MTDAYTGYRTKPNPDQPDRCPSIDPHDTLQCGRRIHDDDQCQLGGIAWKKGTPPQMSDRERADRLEGMCDRLAEKSASLTEVISAVRRYAELTLDSISVERRGMAEDVLNLLNDRAETRVFPPAATDGGAA